MKSDRENVHLLASSDSPSLGNCHLSYSVMIYLCTILKDLFEITTIKILEGESRPKHSGELKNI